jgi:hypothetical protein
MLKPKHTFFVIGLMLLGNSFTAYSQTPALRAPTLPDQVAQLNIKATQAFPYLQREVLGPIQGWVLAIGVSLAVVVAMFSFLRLWRENSGGNSNLLFFFVRAVVFFALVGSSVSIVSNLAAVGMEIAEGDEIRGGDQRAVLIGFYRTQRDQFDDLYKKLVMNTFTAPVDSRDFPIKPHTETGPVLGVADEVRGDVRDLNNKLEDSSFNMVVLFNLLNAARAILEVGDVWLIMLSGILILVGKTVVPLVMALAIDRKLANKVCYPIVWGLIVLTLIWPAISFFIRGLAYLVGNIAVGMSDAGPLYSWDYASMAAVKSSLASPVYSVAIVSVIITIAGLCLLLAPYLAYRVSMGQIYEGVSNSAFQFSTFVSSVATDYTSVLSGSSRSSAEYLERSAGYSQLRNESPLLESGMLGNQAEFIANQSLALSRADDVVFENSTAPGDDYSLVTSDNLGTHRYGSTSIAE